jgi:antitoxin (DNA-binding transcriptional repressor) of toxin-antitoxin stability system
MSTVTLTELQKDPAAWLRRVQAGETLVVMDAERPVAEVRPFLLPSEGRRPYGLAAGEFRVPDDFDAPLPGELLAEFEGR